MQEEKEVAPVSIGQTCFVSKNSYEAAVRAVTDLLKERRVVAVEQARKVNADNARLRKIEEAQDEDAFNAERKCTDGLPLLLLLLCVDASVSARLCGCVYVACVWMRMRVSALFLCTCGAQRRSSFFSQPVWSCFACSVCLDTASVAREARESARAEAVKGAAKKRASLMLAEAQNPTELMQASEAEKKEQAEREKADAKAAVEEEEAARAAFEKAQRKKWKKNPVVEVMPAFVPLSKLESLKVCRASCVGLVTPTIFVPYPATVEKLLVPQYSDDASDLANHFSWSYIVTFSVPALDVDSVGCDLIEVTVELNDDHIATCLAYLPWDRIERIDQARPRLGV
jgi:hypothetical protein